MVCGFDADDEDVSPAESWAKCFPKLRQVCLGPGKKRCDG